MFLELNHGLTVWTITEPFQAHAVLNAMIHGVWETVEPLVVENKAKT